MPKTRANATNGTTTAKADPKPADPKANSSTDDTMAKCLKELTELNQSFKKTLDDHESRITALETQMKAATDVKANQPAPADAPKQDVAQPAQTAAKTDANQDLAKQKRYCFADGPRELWLWKDHKTGLWRGPIESLVTAQNRSAVVAPYYVWIEDGLVARTLTDEEVARYF
ncbi:hypothetical protein IKG60_01900 [Candidatus Saccharibacteria bacterium]|nr:hypothetical protein [Candidatus Saccharibacteria bacterium]